MNDFEKLAQAIEAIEAQRAILGNEVVETALAPMREKLAVLKTQSQPAEVQRKFITILFADISGFTALTEMLDAEEVRDMVNILWQSLDEAIIAHGGRVDKHIGDSVMALWGVEEIQEDNVEQAIKAALAMQSILKNLNLQITKQTGDSKDVSHISPQVKVKLQMRIGLHTGPAILGVIGTTGEFTAMGDTVNLASRLEGAAPVDGVLISHDTYRQVRGVFDVTLQAPLHVKGKAEPVQTYIVHCAKPRAFRIPMRGVEGVETRMIGRAAEMFQLQKLFETCVSERTTQVVSVVGEAGLGKSRLMQEFFDWAESSPVLCRLFRGRSTPSVMDSPYALLRDLFAFRFEIQEDKSLIAARETLEQGIMSLLPNDPQAQEKAHFIGHLLGWDFSASPYVRGLLSDAAQIRTLATHFLTLFISAIAQERPLVILLDDLHWADRGSLDVLRHILENLPPNTPLMLIANTRPALFERYPAWKMIAKTQIYLHPLTDNDSAALVSDILRYLPTLPSTLQDLIVQQAEGNPFYVEELIKMLIDEKVIQPGANEWRVTVERLKNLHVPPTLVGILQARLDSLPPVERLVLQQASVMGRTFWDTAIKALDSTSPNLETLHVTLDAIQSRELLFRGMTSAFSDTREYRFKHALLHDVTYETVLKRDRPAYHARAAVWLESVCGARRNEYLPLLAEHSEKAGNLENAAALWNEAGERALQLSAFAEAADFYKRAVELAPQVSSLLCKLGKAYFHLGELQVAQEVLRQSQESAVTVSDRVNARAEISALESSMGNYAEAQELLMETVPLARTSGDPALLSRALFELGDVNWRLGKLDEARSAIEECLALSRSIGDVQQELYALNRLGVVLGHFDLDAGDRFLLEAHARAMELGNRNLALMAMNNLGEAAKVRQDYTAAREYHQQALVQAQAIGAQWYIVMLIFNLAEDDIFLGRFSAARSSLHEGLALTVRLKMPSFAIPAMIYFGHLAYAEGQVERALDLWGLAQKHPAWSSDNQYELNMALERSMLDPAVIQKGLEHGATLDLDQTIKELLDE